MTFIITQTARLFLMVTLAIQQGSCGFSKSKFRRVTQADQITSITDTTLTITHGGGLFSNVNTTLVCAVFCTKSDVCKNFAWDPVSKDCSVGLVDTHNPSGSLPTPSGQALIFQRLLHCPTSLGYELRYAGQTPMCLKFVGEEMNKPEAVDMCASFLGSLVKTNTQEKIDLVLELGSENTQSNSFFIHVGGSDEVEEGHFTWSDGRPFTAQEYGLFPPGEPNGGRTENDIMVGIGYPHLFDIGFCPANFVCEMSVWY